MAPTMLEDTVVQVMNSRPTMGFDLSDNVDEDKTEYEDEDETTKPTKLMWWWSMPRWPLREKRRVAEKAAGR